MRRHKVGELEGDDLFRHIFMSLQFEPEVAPIGGGELDRHIPVEGFQVRPDLDAVLLA